MQKILFISANNIGSGLSGGDRIFLELARNWIKNINITILGSEETSNLLHRYQVNTKFISVDRLDNSPIIIHQIRRTFRAIFYILKNKNQFSDYDYIYSVSDFYPDFLPAFFLKLLKPQLKWIAGYYLNAPNPISSSSPYNQTDNFFKGLIYFLGQIPSKFFINIFADIVYITSEPDRKYFSSKKTVVVRGGVPDFYCDFPKSSAIKYQAVFLGRFHPQKGVLELIDIWKIVTGVLPSAKLAIIGRGDLLPKIIKKIKQNHLSNNIKLFGFLDGKAKLKVFSQSQIFVHPATYDSGGMAAAEAMAMGLPGVSFDLESLKTYYPKGMVKTRFLDLKEFSDNIIKLLQNPVFYKKTSLDSKKLTKDFWIWSKQAKRIYEETFSKRQVS